VPLGQVAKLQPSERRAYGRLVQAGRSAECAERAPGADRQGIQHPQRDGIEVVELRP
jgi:hypothetical protein